MQVNQQRIVVLGTGGTIAGRGTAGDNVGYEAGQIDVADLLHGLPAARWRVDSEQVAQVDSKDMDLGIWLALAQRCAHWLAQEDVGGLVITHGTDTMEETAFFLQAVLAPAKPVVLTGAMRPATSAAADGPQNLADAITVASGGGHGVSVVFAGAIHAAGAVSKRNSYRLDAFTSGEAGPLGFVEEGRLRLLRPWPEATPLRPLSDLVPAARWPRVEIVMNHAGADGAIVRALVGDGVAGIVVAGTGNGSLHHRLQAALEQAQAGGVAVRRSTRCPEGPVIALAGDVLPQADGLSPVKARIALMLALMR